MDKYKKAEPYLFIASVIALVFVFYGCEKQEPIQETLNSDSVLECRDGHLYSIVSKTRYELIEKDGCTSGKINLKD